MQNCSYLLHFIIHSIFWVTFPCISHSVLKTLRSLIKLSFAISLNQAWFWGVLLRRAIHGSNIKFGTWFIDSAFGRCYLDLWIFFLDYGCMSFQLSNLSWFLDLKVHLPNKHLISSSLVSWDANSVALNFFSFARRDTLRN